MKITIEEYVNRIFRADFDVLLKLRNPDMESFVEFEEIGAEEFDIIYGAWYQTIK